MAGAEDLRRLEEAVQTAAAMDSPKRASEVLRLAPNWLGRVLRLTSEAVVVDPKLVSKVVVAGSKTSESFV